ncbi:LysM peptidoglycan-binding domain-containing protein [Streptococcus sobrinus]|uniref:LysM peptidoglycan-binding domain-containing protein n=1 Tax=Streptococcus sobrinus TaxID=1310 RepID=UPI000D7068BE|nr:LysM domain-containing protein [Streptococcus sobrinus]AWN60769.1 peptidoglycan-binding protein LysM [Streptococcus sobrinus]AWN62641.1 peptidoglycan-binding protein LysM [Streptococcus sobrinus]SQG18312.1 Group B streptococcal surface immunogenic protein [Streptococcus sobrinus]
MKLNKKMLLASTLALSVFAATQVQAEEANANQNWTPRSVEEVKADLANQGDTTTYTVKSGDTLSTIAQAMGIDVNVLAKVNAIADVNVIYPDTVITATYDANHNATGVTIQAADQSAPQASVDLSNNQVTVGDTTTSLDAIETPASSEAPATDNSQAMPAPEAPASEGAQTSEVSDQAAATSEVADQGQAQSVTAEQATPVADQGQGAPAAPQADNQANDQLASSEMPAASSEDNQSEAPAPASESQAQEESVPAEQAPAAQEAEQGTATEQAAPQNSSVNTDGMSPSAANFANNVANQYGTTDIGGYRQGDSGDHGSGNAVDVMTYDNTQLGQEVADYATSNMEANNISYVIYQQKFYAPTDNIYGPAYTWNEMPDRGDATANHMDHVHVSFNN